MPRLTATRDMAMRMAANGASAEEISVALDLHIAAARQIVADYERYKAELARVMQDS